MFLKKIEISFGVSLAATFLVAFSLAYGADVIDVPVDGGDLVQCSQVEVPGECVGLTASEYVDFLRYQFQTPLDSAYCSQASLDSFESGSFLSMYGPGKGGFFKKCYEWICGKKPDSPDLPDGPNNPDLPDGPNRPDLPDGPNGPDLPGQKTCPLPEACDMGKSNCEGFDSWGLDGTGAGIRFKKRCTEQLATFGGCIGAVQASLSRGCTSFKAGDRKLTTAQVLLIFSNKMTECRNCVKFYCN